MNCSPITDQNPVFTSPLFSASIQKQFFFPLTNPAPHFLTAAQSELSLHEDRALYLRVCLRNVNYSTWRQQSISWRRCRWIAPIAECKNENFQQAESDLQYMEHKLEFEFMSSLPENSAVEENPVKLLENLSAIKARHKALVTQVEQIALEQKQSMEAIREQLSSTVHIVQQLQQSTDIETASCSEPAAVTQQPQLPAEPQFEPVSEEALDLVPRGVRSNIKLAELNALYRQLYQYFSKRRDSAALSVLQMNKMNMKPSDTKLKILKHLSLIELDRKGHVRLAPRL
ncbi:spindle and kinetochore-associated protein 2-like isoform X2 [Acipenser ruthenus]|uniref:spindle and kinetochore-associated protein 2-like isoform X2 n=1 Tax=Acipenser ruthenus TaxID=7906 RepID=UPI0027407EA4|nr:spindle and kinetochore-associated protein 2-like isoform X2 [Acipenser ruthenus]